MFDAAHAEEAERFRALHQSAPFIIPNPWDAGSARNREWPATPRLHE